MTEASQDSLDYDELAALLQHAGYGETPAHFHGALCGLLCVMTPQEVDLDSLLDEGGERSEPLDANSRVALRRLRDSSEADLLSTDMVFEPLLPPDPAPLSARVDGLADWCSGFLYGLSSRKKLDVKKLSEEARETLRDFTQFTQAGFDASGDPESEEAAFFELVEYVRVGAQLMFLELRPRPASVDDESSTIH